MNKSSIFRTVYKLVYDSQSLEQFEKGLRVMVNIYELHDNDWLLGLYDN